jgi:hypothetical protein
VVHTVASTSLVRSLIPSSRLLVFVIHHYVLSPRRATWPAVFGGTGRTACLARQPRSLDHASIGILLACIEDTGRPGLAASSRARGPGCGRDNPLSVSAQSRGRSPLLCSSADDSEARSGGKPFYPTVGLRRTTVVHPVASTSLVRSLIPSSRLLVFVIHHYVLSPRRATWPAVFGGTGRSACLARQPRSLDHASIGILLACIEDTGRPGLAASSRARGSVRPRQPSLRVGPIKGPITRYCVRPQTTLKPGLEANPSNPRLAYAGPKWSTRSPPPAWYAP